MAKTILVTGATDGIGLETAKRLAGEGHTVLLHGRSASKLEAARAAVGGESETYLADLSRLKDVRALAAEIAGRHDTVDVLINNAGVLKAPEPVTADGLDLRFVVNTLAPYLLTRLLLPRIPAAGRVVNLASAAQAPVDIGALRGERRLADMQAYAQSKLALIVWTRALAAEYPDGPALIAVNPGSLLASKMVREGFGVAGSDIGIGADILVQAALSETFEGRSGAYYDNDSGAFAEPHAGARDTTSAQAIMATLDALLET
jgi:NAD(P)-dependent dehydrogenase (short-subunit alcohol dehydrogenase family)